MVGIIRPEALSIRAVDGSIVKLEHFDALSSTQEVAKRYANEGAPDRYVVFTERRVLDDGTIEKGLFMSLILRPSIFPSQASLIGAMSATAFITALEGHTTKRLGLGWVSDLYCNGSLIGSTSIEGKLDNFTSYEYLIVSFEAKYDDKLMPPRLTDMIKQVFESNNASVNMIIAKNVLNNFLSYYQHIKTSTKFMDIYMKKFVLRNVTIRHIVDGKKYRRRILGVDAKSGALILEGKRGNTRVGASIKDSRIFVSSPSSVIMPKRVKM